MSLKIIFYLSFIFLVACNTTTKKSGEISDSNKEEIKEAIYDSINDNTNADNYNDNWTEFASEFPVVDSFPICKELLKTTYDFNKREEYSEFSRMIKEDVFTDASESPWYYQPVLQFQYDDNAFVMVALEYDEDNNVERYHLIRRELIWDDHKEEYFLGTRWEINIAEKREDEIIKAYEFLDDSFDSLLIRKKNEPDIVLRRFNKNFSNIKRFFKLTRNENQNFPDDYNPNEVFSNISNGWSARAQLDSILKTDVSRLLEFSKYIHFRTHLDKTYIGYDVNNVPYIFPLGVKTVYDSLKLYIVYSEYIEQSENYKVYKTIKMFLCDRDLTRLVDYKSFSCVGDINSDLQYSDSTFYFVTDDNIKIPLVFNYNGILPQQHYFKKLISTIDEVSIPLTLFEEDLMKVSYVDVDGLNAFVGFFLKKVSGYVACFGKIETSSEVLILLNESEEITSGEHFVIDSYYAAVFNKKSGEFQHIVLLYSNFDGVQAYVTSNSVLLFPGGEENYELIHGEDGNFYPIPDDTLRITNYGFVKSSQVFPCDSIVNSIDILDWFKSYKSPNLVEISDFNCVENDTLRIFSNMLNSLIFDENEDYIVKYFPESFKNLNDSLVYLKWKRLDPHNYLYESYGYIYLTESGVYNKHTKSISEIRKYNYKTEL